MSGHREIAHECRKMPRPQFRLRFQFSIRWLIGVTAAIAVMLALGVTAAIAVMLALRHLLLFLFIALVPWVLLFLVVTLVGVAVGFTIDGAISVWCPARRRVEPPGGEPRVRGRPQFHLRSLFILTAIMAVECWFLARAIPARHFQPDDDFLIGLMCAIIAFAGYAVYRAGNYVDSRRRRSALPRTPMPDE
jgi:hypothetical protein